MILDRFSEEVTIIKGLYYVDLNIKEQCEIKTNHYPNTFIVKVRLTFSMIHLPTSFCSTTQYYGSELGKREISQRRWSDLHV